MNTFAIAIAVGMVSAGSNTHTELITDSVDLVEINHCYDENGQLVFDQLLFYDWCADKGHYDVRDWRLLKSPIQLPRRNQQTGTYVAVWRDGPVMRKVHAKTIRESWTQYDPEIREQAFLPKDKRRALPKFVMRRRASTVRRTSTENHRQARSSSEETVR